MSTTTRFRRAIRGVSTLIVATVIATAAFAIGAPTSEAFDAATDCRHAAIGTDGGTGDSDFRTADPTVRDDEFATTWNGPVYGYLLGNDDDGIVNTPTLPGNQDGLQAELWRSPQYGTLTLYPNGHFSYVPNLTITPADVVDTFEYIGHNTLSDFCSPSFATVSISIAGFTETVDQAPNGNPDTFPADGTSVLRTDVLTIPAPGVLANDYNGVSHVANDNLEAHLLSQPVWDGFGGSAGTITDWGVTSSEGVTVVDNSGGFTYTPTLSGAGTTLANFTYEVCYRVRPVTATACSAPITASIRVDPARPGSTIAGSAP